MLASLAAVIAYRRSRHRYAWAMAAGCSAGLAILTRANALILLSRSRSPSGPGARGARAAVAAPALLVVAALLTVAPWTIRNARELHAFVPVSTQFGSALAGTYNDAARADTQNPAAWRALKRVPDYAYLFRRVGETNEAVLEAELRAASLHSSATHPTYVARSGAGRRGGCSTSPADGARHTAATITINHVWADRGVICFWIFAALALAGAFTAMARRTPWYVWAMPDPDVLQRRLPRRRDAALPHPDRPVHRPPGHGGAGHGRPPGAGFEVVRSLFATHAEGRGAADARGLTVAFARLRA